MNNTDDMDIVNWVGGAEGDRAMLTQVDAHRPYGGKEERGIHVGADVRVPYTLNVKMNRKTLTVIQMNCARRKKEERRAGGSRK